MTAKVFSESWWWLCRLVHHQLDGGIASQGFRIGASFMRILHDALNLGAIDSRELSMQFNCQAIAGLVILDQAHQCAHRGLFERGAKLLGSVAQCAVVTGGIRPANNSSGLGPRFSAPFSNGFPNVTFSNWSGV